MFEQEPIKVQEPDEKLRRNEGFHAGDVEIGPDGVALTPSESRKKKEEMKEKMGGEGWREQK